MKNYSVNGSVVSSSCIVDTSFQDDTVDIEITLGVQEILTLLDDLLSCQDGLSKEDFQRLLGIAGEIQSLAVLRDAEEICFNCKEPRGSCPNCENFGKICGGC